MCTLGTLPQERAPPPAAIMFLRRKALIRKGTAARPSPISSLSPTETDSESGQGDGRRTLDWTSIHIMLSGRATLPGQGLSRTGGTAVRTLPSPVTAHMEAAGHLSTPGTRIPGGLHHRPGPGRHGPAYTELAPTITHTNISLFWTGDWTGPFSSSASKPATSPDPEQASAVVGPSTAMTGAAFDQGSGRSTRKENGPPPGNPWYGIRPVEPLGWIRPETGVVSQPHQRRPRAVGPVRVRTRAGLHTAAQSSCRNGTVTTIAQARRTVGLSYRPASRAGSFIHTAGLGQSGHETSLADAPARRPGRGGNHP